MKRKIKAADILEALIALVTAAALALGLTVSGELLMPRRWDYGGTWDMYLQEDEDTIDVMFFGTSLAYCDVIPPLIYESTGLTAYVMAGPGQTVPITYYYIREALKTQSPKYIFVEATSIFDDSVTFANVNVGYMPWSLNRVAAALTCEPEERRGLFFPLYSYHSRLVERTEEAFRPLFSSPADDLCGYTFLNTSTPIEGDIIEEEWRGSSQTEEFAADLEYFGRISDYCAENGIELIFYFTPTTNPVPPEDMDALLAHLSRLDCLDVLDLSLSAAEIGIDYETDWYDKRHLNFSGAKKFTGFISGYIAQLGIEPQGTADPGLWAERVEKCLSRA